MSSGFFSFIIIALIIYTYTIINGEINKSKLSDDEILQLMENGFVDGGVEDNDILINRELKAVEDVFNEVKKEAGNNSTEIKRKVFYEGDINWKFVDNSSTNTDCWKNWDYIRRKENGEDEIIKENVERTIRREDGRVWCPVNEFTDADSRRENDKPPTILDMMENNIDKIWGLAGAVGLGLTEEFILSSMKKKAMQSAKNVATKSTKEMFEESFKKIGKEMKQEFSEKFVKKFTKKLGNETGEGIFKNTQKKILVEFKKEVSEKISKVLSKELSNKTFASFKKEVLENYGKKTINSLKDDFMKKAFTNITKSLDDITLKKLSAIAKNTASVALKEASKKISYIALSASLKAKLLNSALKQAKDFMYSVVYRNIMSALKAVVNAVSKLSSKLLWKIVSLKTKAILALKTFFRTQAKSFLSIGKNLIKNVDDVAKMVKSLVMLSKTISKTSIKVGFRTAMKGIGKMLIKMKPGPLALFDMVSFALDMADVGGFSAYISTDDFKKEIAKSNAEMRKSYVDAIRSNSFYKDMNINPDDIDYPRVLDPTNDVPMDELQDLISEKFNTIFRLANIGERHTIIKTFFSSLESDLENGVITPESLEDENVMNGYIEKIDLEEITNLVSNDLCNRVGGLIYDTNRCTYTKEQCNNLYKWPLDTEEKEDRKDEIYAEFQNDKCVQANHMPRYLCETAKAKWDVDKNSCLMDKNWCLKMGAEYDLNTGNCNIPLSQKIIENIFGTSMTRLFKGLVNPMVRPTQELLNVFLNPPTTNEYVGTIKNEAMSKCFSLNTDTFPYRVELKDCGGGNEQQFYYNLETGLIVADATKYKGRFLCLERPYGTGDIMYANYCDNSLSKDQTWDVDVVKHTINHKSSKDPVYAKGLFASIGSSSTSNERKLIIGVVKNSNVDDFGKKVATSAMNITTFGAVDWSPIIESGSVMFKVMTVVPEVARAFTSIFSQTCDITGAGNQVMKVAETTTSTQTVQNTHYCGPIKIRDKCLDVKDSKLFDGAKPVIWDCNGGKNQNFAYHHVDKTIKSNLDKNFCLDIGSGNDGDDLKWWGCNGTQPQKFNYDPTTKQISLVGNKSKCLDLTMDNNTNGNEFKVLGCKVHRAQQFNIKGCDEDEYINTIGNAAAKTFLDAINPFNWF